MWNDINEDEEIHTDSPWLIRFEIDSGKLTSKGLTIEKIANTITEAFEGHPIHIVRHFDQEEMSKLVLRFRPPHYKEEDTPTPV